MKIPRIFSAALLFVAILSVFFSTACPKKDAIREAAKASYRLPGATNDLIDRIREGVNRGIFTPAEARKAGEILERVAQLEVGFVQVVKTAERIYRATGQIPTAELAAVRIKYDEIIDAFLDVLEFTGILDPDDRAFIEAAVSAVRLFLRSIGVGFGFKSSVDKLNAFRKATPPEALPRPAKTKKGITTAAALFGSTSRISFNPQMRFA